MQILLTKAKIMMFKYFLILSLLGQIFFLAAIVHAQRTISDDFNTDQTSSADKKALPGFSSDGCTMWFNADYLDCCVLHDLAYWNNSSSWRMRLRADNHLFLCVATKKGSWHLVVAPIMWTGVRVFGSDLLPVSNKNIVHKFSQSIFRSIKN